MELESIEQAMEIDGASNLLLAIDTTPKQEVKLTGDNVKNPYISKEQFKEFFCICLKKNDVKKFDEFLSSSSHDFKNNIEYQLSINPHLQVWFLSIFAIASENGSVDFVKYLVQDLTINPKTIRGKKLNGDDELIWHRALIKNKTEVVELLLDQKLIDISLSDIISILSDDHVEMLKLCIDKKAINTQVVYSHSSLLAHAINYSAKKSTLYLMENDHLLIYTFPALSPDMCATSPLIYACVMNNIGMVSFLLSNKVNPNQPDPFNILPLQKAFDGLHDLSLPIINLLLQYGAELEDCTPTCLHKAVSVDSKFLVDACIKKINGCLLSVNAQNKTAWEIAKEKNRKNALDYIFTKKIQESLDKKCLSCFTNDIIVISCYKCLYLMCQDCSTMPRANCPGCLK